MNAAAATQLVTGPGFRLRIRAGWRTRLAEAGALDAAGLERWLRDAPRVSGGRSVNRLLEGPPGEPTLRVRPARHGGLLAGWTGDRFRSPGRIEAELDRWIRLVERGAPVPEAVFAASWRRGLFWRSMIASVDLFETRDLARWLADEPDEAARLRVARTVGRTLRRFHEAGAIHGDLHLGNLLVDRSGGRVWLVDLDRSRLVDPVRPADRLRDWMRLVRSIEKSGHREALTPRVRAAALAAYCAGDGELRRAIGLARAREERRLQRHRLGWWLARTFGTSSARRIAAGGLAIGSAGLALLGCEPPDPTDPSLAPPPGGRLSLLAVGDTGRTRPFAALFEGALSVSSAMTREAIRDPVDGLVLLGDNFYWHGLAGETLVPQVAEQLVRPFCYFLRLDGPRSAEVSEACRRPPPERAPVPVYAVLGNHDLETKESPQLQREIVPAFLPNWRMSPGLARAIELGQGVSLILFESEPEIDDREAIRRALIGAIRAAEGPWRILATHRPVATDDLARPFVGGYPEFVLSAIASAQRPVQLVLAAHHHNLQVFELSGATPLLHVGVGSGARAEPPIAEDHPDARFGRMALGFVRVDLIGRGDAERLSATLFEAPRWPLLGRWQPARPVARFEVDGAGQIRRAEPPLADGPRADRSRLTLHRSAPRSRAPRAVWPEPSPAGS